MPIARLAERLYAAPILLLVLTTAFWAGNAIAGQLTEGRVSPMAVVFLRWVMVAAMLWALFGGEAMRHWPSIKPRFWAIAGMAFLGFTAFNALFYIASLYTTAVNVGILQGMMPILVLGMDYLAHGQRLTAMQAIGAPLALLGVVVVATGGDLSQAFADGLNVGDVMMLVAGAFYAFYAIRLRKRPDIPGRAFFTWMAPIAALTAVPLLAAEIAVGDFHMPTAEGWLVTLYIAIFPSCLAQLFFLRGVDLIGPGRAGMFINLVPIFTAVFAVALLGETFALHHALALGLVVTGIALAQMSALKPASK